MLGTGKLYSIIEIGRLFKHKIKMVPKRKGERLSSLFIGKNNQALRYLKYRPKVKIKDYINEFIKKEKKKF